MPAFRCDEDENEDIANLLSLVQAISAHEAQIGAWAKT